MWAVDEYRAVELLRLDAVLAASWDKAMDGDVKAVNVILRVIDQRCGLLGLT